MGLINRISFKKVIIDFFVIVIFAAVFNTIWSWRGTGANIYNDDIEKFDYYFSLVLSQFIGFLWAYKRYPENRLGHLMAIGILFSIVPFIVNVIIVFDVEALVYAMGTIYVPLFAAYGLRKYVVKCH